VSQWLSWVIDTQNVRSVSLWNVYLHIHIGLNSGYRIVNKCLNIRLKQIGIWKQWEELNQLWIFDERKLDIIKYTNTFWWSKSLNHSDNIWILKQFLGNHIWIMNQIHLFLRGAKIRIIQSYLVSQKSWDLGGELDCVNHRLW